MAKKDFTKTSKILLWLLAAGEAVDSLIITTPKDLKWRINHGDIFKTKNTFTSLAYSLVRRGLIKVENKNNEKFLKLTQKGEIEALLVKARLNQKPTKWDGKWRLVLFDIPEESNKKRDFIRRLLKKNNFYKLQASVYINPYPLNREAVTYLNESGLIEFIRILKVEEMDNDKDLKKHFEL